MKNGDTWHRGPLTKSLCLQIPSMPPSETDDTPVASCSSSSDAGSDGVAYPKTITYQPLRCSFGSIDLYWDCSLYLQSHCPGNHV